MTARSHSRTRRAVNHRRRVAYLKHRAEKEAGKGRTKRKTAARRKDEIERTVKVLNEKGTNT